MTPRPVQDESRRIEPARQCSRQAQHAHRGCVGQHHRDDHFRLTRQHLRQPWVRRLAVPKHHGHRTRDQEPPEITLTHLRYLAKPRLAAGRVLSRHQAEPTDEVAAAPETLHWRCKRLERHRGDRANLRYRHQSRRLFDLARVGLQVLLQALDLRIDLCDLVEQEPAQLAS